MATTAKVASARVIPFPNCASHPVVQKPRPGRFPKMVVHIRELNRRRVIRQDKQDELFKARVAVDAVTSYLAVCKFRLYQAKKQLGECHV